MSLSNGLILKYDYVNQQVLTIFAMQSAIIDQIKIYKDKILITAGIDSQVRFWDIDSAQMLGNFEIHTHCV